MWVIPLVLLVVIGSYFLFKDTLNRIQYVGPLYWITRDNGTDNDPVVTRAFMRQTSAPWKTGKGIQIRAGKYTFQFGLCRSSKLRSEDEGILHALQGRYMDTAAKDIGDWK